MTEAEKKEIVALVMSEISGQAVDFDLQTVTPQRTDILPAVRPDGAGGYTGVTLDWGGITDELTTQATQAKNDAETAKNTANTILTQVQNKGTEITNFVATSKTEIEAQKDESVNAVKSVYQTDLNELKGDLGDMMEDLSYAPKKNLIDYNACIMNKELISNSGTIGDATGWYVTDWIEVEPNTSYALSGMSSVYKAEVDETKTKYTSVSSVINNVFTTGSETKYVRFNSLISGYSTPQLEKGVAVTDYEPYSLTSKRVLSVEERIKILEESENKSVPTIIIPSIINCAVGTEVNLYYKNIISCDDISKYDIDWSMGSATTISRVFNECLRITPVNVSDGYTCILKIKDKVTAKTITQKSFVLKCFDKSIRKKVIFIGDSLTDRGIYPAEIQANLSKNGIETLGTLTDTVTIGGVEITTHNEGRSGWSAYNYLNSQEYNGLTNAFYNPSTKTFDFSYYMSNNGYSSVDIVVITLGTNDIAGLDSLTGDFATVVNNIKSMVDSVHLYNSNIKVIVSLTTPPAKQDGWGKSNGRTGSSLGFEYRQKKLVSLLIAQFDGIEDNTIVSPNYINIDTEHDFPCTSERVSNRNPYQITRQTDNVHPSEYGYLKMADVIWGAIQSVS